MATRTGTTPTEPAPNGPSSQIDLEAARSLTLGRLQETCDRLARAELERRLAEIESALSTARTASPSVQPDHTRPPHL